MPIGRGTLGTGGAVVAVAAGALLTLGAVAATLLVLFMTELGCGGSDVSEPPAPGSTAAGLCGWPRIVSYVAFLPFAVVAPLAGGLLAAVVRRLRPLAAGAAVSTGAMILPASFAEHVQSADGFLTVPTVALFVLAVVLAARAG